MTQITPLVQDDTLTYQRGGQAQTVVVGTPTWYDWLQKATTFAFYQ